MSFGQLHQEAAVLHSPVYSLQSTRGRGLDKGKRHTSMLSKVGVTLGRYLTVNLGTEIAGQNGHGHSKL